jgi:hypothetical protein
MRAMREDTVRAKPSTGGAIGARALGLPPRGCRWPGSAELDQVAGVA